MSQNLRIFFFALTYLFIFLNLILNIRYSIHVFTYLFILFLVLNIYHSIHLSFCILLLF